MERSGVAHQNQNQDGAVQGRWVWKQVFKPSAAHPPPSAAGWRTETSAGAESEEPVPKKPRLVSIGGGCWFRGDATQAGEVVSPSRQLSHNEIAERLSSTSENPQTQNKTPTPDSASAAAMMSKRREGVKLTTIFCHQLS